MAFAISRYLEEKSIERKEFLYEVITPLFLGNADQEAELRSAPFKGLIRYWWRVTQHKLNDASKLLFAESKIFGSAGENDGSGRSRIKIIVQPDGDKPMKAVKTPFPFLKSINHPEVNKSNVNPLQYLAGMGIMRGVNINRSYFPPGTRFKVSFEYPASIKDEIIPVLCLAQAFGTIGARSRNGWGSIQVLSETIPIGQIPQKISNITIPWQQGMLNDYPNCLGKDAIGDLLWKTTARNSWGETMRDLADAYVDIRARTVSDIQKLNPGGRNQINERHLLGIPLTNHTVIDKSKGWVKDSRHASPLRFFVRRQDEKYHGYILHLPHSFSMQKKLPPEIDQLVIWENVHKKLDGIALLTRAKIEDCL